MDLADSEAITSSATISTVSSASAASVRACWADQNSLFSLLTDTIFGSASCMKDSFRLSSANFKSLLAHGNKRQLEDPHPVACRHPPNRGEPGRRERRGGGLARD